MTFRIIPFKKNNPDSLRRMYSIEFKNMVNIVIIPLLSRTLTALFGSRGMRPTRKNALRRHKMRVGYAKQGHSRVTHD